MFFLLRSLFWLTLVFSSMSWSESDKHAGAQVVNAALSQSGAAVAGAVRQAAFSQVEAQLIRVTATAVPMKPRGSCAQPDEACSKDTARLDALFAANAADAVFGDDGAALPLPPVRSRLH